MRLCRGDGFNPPAKDLVDTVYPVAITDKLTLLHSGIIKIQRC